MDSIEDELKLSDAQRASWTAYADRVQKLADDMSRMRFEARTARTERGTAVVQLEQIAIGERARMNAIDEIVELGRTLYAALTPEQRAFADRRLAVVLTTITTGVVPRAWNDPASRGG